LWADRNVGATCVDTSISWYGGYYAWGETETKDNYSWDNYKFGERESLTKYNSSDNKTILESADDVATKYCTDMKLPSYDELNELITNTTYTWVTTYNDIDGLNGMLFTSNINSNVLFIPANGRIAEEIDKDGEMFTLWSNGITQFDGMTFWINARSLYGHYDNDIEIAEDPHRSEGFGIRGVKSSN